MNALIHFLRRCIKCYHRLKLLMIILTTLKMNSNGYLVEFEDRRLKLIDIHMKAYFFDQGVWAIKSEFIFERTGPHHGLVGTKSQINNTWWLQERDISRL